MSDQSILRYQVVLMENPSLPVSPCEVLFFKYKFIYFNWRLITLQYFIGFAIQQHDIHVFPILSPPFLTTCDTKFSISDI